MPLSDAHFAVARGWIQSRLPAFSCRACGGPKHPGDALVKLNAVEPGGAISLGDGPLMVPLRCESCGHVDLFDAKRMGITLDPGSEEGDTAADGMGLFDG